VQKSQTTQEAWTWSNCHGDEMPSPLNQGWMSIPGSQSWRQPNPRRNLPWCSTFGRWGDDPDEARREELEQGELARRGGDMAKRVLPGWVGYG
jgi:hypothetical protein